MDDRKFDFFQAICKVQNRANESVITIEAIKVETLKEEKEEGIPV